MNCRMQQKRHAGDEQLSTARKRHSSMLQPLPTLFIQWERRDSQRWIRHGVSRVLSQDGGSLDLQGQVKPRLHSGPVHRSARFASDLTEGSCSSDAPNPTTVRT
jgi:hypothetical protein